MPRIKRGTTVKARHKKILEQAKGFYGRRKNTFKTANQAVMASLQYQYIGRRHRKRDIRSLWIQRINAGTRSHGMPYSEFVHGLNLLKIDINKKVLADMAVHHSSEFKCLVLMVRKHYDKLNLQPRSLVHLGDLCQ